MINTILIGTLSASAPLILWLIKFFGTKLTDMLADFLKKKTNNDYIANVIRRIDDTALRIVKSVYQEYVAGLKKQKASLNKDERETALDMALEKLKSYLGPKGLEEIGDVFGFDIKALIRRRMARRGGWRRRSRSSHHQHQHRVGGDQPAGDGEPGVVSKFRHGGSPRRASSRSCRFLARS